MCVCSVAAPAGQSFVNFIFGTFRKSAQELQIRLKSENGIGHFAQRPAYVYIVDSNMKREAHSCVSMATLKGFILLTTTCMSIAVQRKGIVTFLWQQWLREFTVILRYAYIA